MGVCTSKRTDFAEKILEMFGLWDCFSFVSGGDVGIRKADQLGGLLRDGLIDRTAVMIGDRAVDILASRDNGLFSAGVLWGYGSRDELESAGPHKRFSNGRTRSRDWLCKKDRGGTCGTAHLIQLLRSPLRYLFGSANDVLPGYRTGSIW